MKHLLAACSSCLLLVFAACGDDSGSGGSGGAGTSTTTVSSTTDAATGTTTQATATSTTDATSTGAGGAQPFALTSSAFAEGEMFPQENVCMNGGGQNLSPPLAWTPGPTGTMSYAIVMRDLDFQNGFLHWVIWDIPADVLSLPEGVENTYQPSIPAGAKQAPFNNQLVGYLGPCSPNSVNTYEFTLHAIGSATLGGLDQNSTKAQAAAAVEAASIASTSLSGES